MPIATRSTMPSSTPAADFFAAYLQDSVTQKLDLNAFVWPEDLRPASSSGGGQLSNEIPEIDISAPMLAKSEGIRAAAAAKISKAAKEWGFFRIVNHGVAADLMSRAEKHAHKFFALQLDQKMRAAGSSSSPFGYAAAGPSRAIMRSWHETLYMLCNHARIEEVARKVWPSARDSDRKDFCKALGDYTTTMNKLGQQLLELLLQGLGVDRSRLNKHYSVEGSSSARINFYPPCPKPDVTFGLPPHTDSGTLTILHQDAVGGLQVCRHGKWIDVQPKPNSFIVNIGDCLQVWSNNLYKSVEHRALVNSSKARMSLAFFYNPTDDTVIAPIKDLTSAKSPAIYKPFSWAEYRLYAATHKSKVLNAIDHFKVRQ